MSHYDEARKHDEQRKNVASIKRSQWEAKRKREGCKHPKFQVIKTMAGWQCKHCRQFLNDKGKVISG